MSAVLHRLAEVVGLLVVGGAFALGLLLAAAIIFMLRRPPEDW